jgi:hypothetical protein
VLRAAVLVSIQKYFQLKSIFIPTLSTALIQFNNKLLSLNKNILLQNISIMTHFLMTTTEIKNSIWNMNAGAQTMFPLTFRLSMHEWSTSTMPTSYYK